MIDINLKDYGPFISDDNLGDEIYQKIRTELGKDSVEIDLSDIESMATYNAKQIFGNLYKLLGSKSFFEKIKIKGANEDIKTIINLGITKALED